MHTKRRRFLVFFAAAVTLLITLASSATVRAGDIQCTGPLGAIHVDNLVVPENASCTLNGTIVDENISVKTNATLIAYGVQVHKDIRADKAARVNVYASSSVGGNLKIVKSGEVDIQSVDINKNLEFNENNQAVNAANNTIRGDLKASKNTGGLSIHGNRIGGNLQCKDNDPPPAGSGNIVSGNQDGQCANFGVLPTPAPTNTPQSPTNTPQIPTHTPVIDQAAPTVQWIAPVLAGERYDIPEGEQVLLEAEAWDNNGITQVTFFRWDAVNLQYVTIQILDQAPFRIDLKAGTLNPGWNQVFVIASDAAGNKSDYPFIWLYKLVGEKLNNLIFLPLVGK